MPVDFSTFGPYALERASGQVSLDNLEDFWSAVSDEAAGLEEAVGVYVIATRKRGGAAKPWYVGKTDVGFGKRFRTHVRTQSAFNPIAGEAPKGKLYVFLIARLNASGAFSGPPRKLHGNRKSIDRVEFALIGSCYSVNRKLMNVSQKSFHAGICVPGYLGSKRGKPTKSAAELARMLEIG